PSRCNHAWAGDDGTGADRQSAGAAAQPPQGSFRAPHRLAGATHLLKQKRPRICEGVLIPIQRGDRSPRSVLLEEAGKLLLEPGDAAAAVEDLLGAAGPGRVRLGVDIEVHRIAVLAPGGAGL